MSENGGLVAIK